MSRQVASAEKMWSSFLEAGLRLGKHLVEFVNPILPPRLLRHSEERVREVYCSALMPQEKRVPNTVPWRCAPQSLLPDLSSNSCWWYLKEGTLGGDQDEMGSWGEVLLSGALWRETWARLPSPGCHGVPSAMPDAAGAPHHVLLNFPDSTTMTGRSFYSLEIICSVNYNRRWVRA